MQTDHAPDLSPDDSSDRTAASDDRQKPGGPLDGVTLENMLTALVARHGWEMLGRLIEIRCFTTDPSIKSSLTFLRKTPWARQKVEQLYLAGASGS